MAEDNFVINREEGGTGELYTQKHLNELITSIASDIIDTSAEKIEGKDFVALIAGKEIAVEVKTVRGFLFRTNDNEEATGTIGFELWKSDKRKTRGWLLQMLNPDGKKSVQPDILIFLLVAYDRPFASIAFENVPELFKRLKQLSTEIGFDLNNIPVGDRATAFTIPSGLLIKNMWMIPLAKLEDLAHVVMIGEQPRLRPTIKAPDRLCKLETQRERYVHLQKIAEAHDVVPYDESFDFKGDKGTQTITIVAKNLDILDSIDFDCYKELKYMNRTGTFLRLWEGVYRFMLSCEYPERVYKGNNYYPIAYGKISRWGYQNGINSQADTWSNAIKHLIEFGILKHFRPHTQSPNPIDIAVNRNNPYPKSVEYYSPVGLTDEVFVYADYYAQDYRCYKRRTSTTSRTAMEIQSGSETAKKAYQDDRKLTKQDKYVWNLAEQTLIDQTEKHNYVIVDVFFAKLWKKIVRIQKLKSFETIQSQEEKKEQARYDRYWRAFNHLKRERKDFIQKLYVYKMGLITKKDRLWLGDIPDGTYIITFKNRPECYDKQYLKALQEDNEKENAKRREKRKAKKDRN